MFEVWAPRADRVRLSIDDRVVAMRRTAGHWWVPAEPIPWHPDVDYGYLLDDDTTPLPDPRSRRQPHGVHGLSRTVSLREPRPWPGKHLTGATIYELHVGTFTPGRTLDSAIERLDHLVELGIDFVELLPVNAFNGTHGWGYDGVLWFAVHEAYGGPAAYQRFVDACHARGLGVIQDVVYNHLGPSGNYLPRFGPYLDDERANTWGQTVNLDGVDSNEVRRYILDNAALWLGEYGVDGLRLDAVHALLDDGETHLLTELATETDALAAALARPLTLIAESDLNDPVMVTPRTDGGFGLTAQWSDDYHHAAHVALTGETSGYYADFDSLAALAKTMTGAFYHDGTFSSFRGRDHGAPVPRETPTFRFVTFTQDHDQVGNRAAGDRLSATLSTDDLALAAFLTVLTPFTPMIFMGEEWGATTPWQYFTSHPEPQLGAATARGRIAEFERMGWDADVVPDPQDPLTLERSTLDWAELDGAEHARLLALYRRLLRLRRETPALTDPDLATVSCVVDESAKWLRLDRDGVCVVYNFAREQRNVPTVGECEPILWSGLTGRVEDHAVALPARTAVVLTVR